MALFKKVGIRCEGADCPQSAEMEVIAYPTDKELSVFLASKGFVSVEVKIETEVAKRLLCAECAQKLNRVFK